MLKGKAQKISDRSPFESYEDILKSDTVPSPDYFKEGPNPDIKSEPFLASRYHDQDFFNKEVKYVWSKVWQWACREEDIPNIGDHHIFNNVGKSLIIVRTKENEIKALINSCLHRGRQILADDGNLDEFRCAFHGLSWNFDGTFKENPFGWDCPQWNGGAPDLPEAKVELWGGFVFINMDLEAEPLSTVLGPMSAHFERYDFSNRYKAAHISKKIKSNWKLSTEAFMESHHVLGTHPQGLPMTGDINSQYDIWNDYVGRQLSAHTVKSPHIKEDISEQQIFNAFTGADHDLEKNPEMRVPEGMTARTFTAQMFRDNLSNETGYDYSHAGDAEMVDSLIYNVFPNYSIWAGMLFNTIYRFRPNGLDPNSSIMDIILLKPVPKDGPRPEPASIKYLDFDEPVTDAAEELGAGLSLVFEQDAVNLPYVHDGLRASGTQTVEFSNYMEKRLRMHHIMLDRLIEEGESKEG